MEKIKSYLNAVLAAVVVILGGILFNRNRKLQQTESELAKAVADKEISENEKDRQITRDHANALVGEYERSRTD